MCEWRRSVNSEASISGEHQTIEGHSCRPSEVLASLMTVAGSLWERLKFVSKHLGLLPNQCDNPKLPLSETWVLRDND